MARFISVVRDSVSNNSGSPTIVITGNTNVSGVPSNTYGVVLSILASNKNANSQNVTVQLVKGGSTTASLVTSGIVPSQSSLEFTITIGQRSESLGHAFINGVANPEIKKFSGEIIYIDNRAPVTRTTSTKREVKIVIEF